MPALQNFRLGEVETAKPGPLQDEEDSEASILAALHCWMCVSGSAVVVMVAGVAVVAAVIFFTTPPLG